MADEPNQPAAAEAKPAAPVAPPQAPPAASAPAPAAPKTDKVTITMAAMGKGFIFTGAAADVSKLADAIANVTFTPETKPVILETSIQLPYGKDGLKATGTQGEITALTDAMRVLRKGFIPGNERLVGIGQAVAKD